MKPSDLVLSLVIEEVGPIGISLHHPEVHHLLEAERQNLLRHKGAHLLAHFSDPVDGHTLHHLHGDYAPRSELLDSQRNPKGGLVLQQSPELLHVTRFVVLKRREEVKRDEKRVKR